ncbi:hypothetical protein D3C76_1269750 [compost metagenome]|jgi:hypothetical protein|uniref:Uncharacterized protein n=1 Tax=Pseudomonas wadenswilerensis TaxID=1785161 RepID=A0A380T4L2_9PSED|nr:hypothetical protein [Pseudomonas]UVM22804.1 hypothetical protein LOY45_04315 [Pseudomonas wadenswilerensis]SPO68587.1 conserved protein of unknown function [Pseudomonas sp. JV241A]SUQ65187.1 hypothetical protein CCOS864_04658 [Pseudomonas wadenswilerensis]
MLKIVPDPPHLPTDSPHCLEDILVQAGEHLTCALAVSQQAVLLHPDLHGQALVRTALHEMETARWRVEQALACVQIAH